MKTNYFGAGCFWGAEYYFLEIDGVIDTRVGFMGGSVKKPDYEYSYDYSEVVEITYDEKQVSYEEILDVFWKIHDPTSEEVIESEERSKQKKKSKKSNIVEEDELRYKSIIFYNNNEERSKAKKSIDELNSMKIFERPIITELREKMEFYSASEYHQKYFLKKYKKRQKFHIIFRLTVIGITLILLYMLKRLN